ncbi:putative diguanylate cyclase AdrA [Oxobacter pfennigii]|uniref:Putative diguanylate cyclase AdrA n=1 Tax=Oxobacter pfennigii TaxID=36849 RepID=A0A0P8WEW4_9CLOT|nr:diguanylate cyclase [Oxobacter pfennigii]KPU46299.1 putative diguanylate cyclase AdrA [Oxobacter pfennigii]
MKLNYLFSSILIISTIIMMGIWIYSWRRRKGTMALNSTAVMLAASLYSLGYAFEIVSTDIEQIQFWLKIEHLGSIFLPIFWLIMTMQYLGYTKYMNKGIYVLLFTIPVISLIFYYVNGWHHLFYTDIFISEHLPFPVVMVERGVWGWICIIYSYLAIAVGVALYIIMFKRSAPLIKKQVLFMLFAALAPLILNMIYVFGGFAHHIDLSPLGFMISGLFYCMIILKFNLLRLTPIAYEKVFKSMKDGVIVLDDENNVINYNNSAKNIIIELNYNSSIGEKYSYLFKRYPEIIDILERKAETDNIQASIVNEKGIKHYNVSLSFIKNRSLNNLGKIITIRDVTEQVDMMQKLDMLASTDELTKLYNRRQFYQKCEIEIERAKRYNRPLTIAIFDIDHFKQINDTYGHHVGDLALKNIADICKKSVRTSDIIARYGGEEFALLLPETNFKDALRTVERLRVAISKEDLEVDENKINVTASFGICSLDLESNQSLSDLIIKADRALYDAKKLGRNKTVSYK